MDIEMPLYDYKCVGCQKVTTLLRSVDERDDCCKCSHCRRISMKRVVSQAGEPILKGKGWYKTDFK
jgi:putative FmdB family regulatory protein